MNYTFDSPPIIINSLVNIGLDRLTGGKPSFINFTENLLHQRVPTYFNPKDIIIEVLETVVPSAKVVARCQELKQLGYKIALDDFVLNESNVHARSLVKLADFIKVDFLTTSKEERAQIEMLAGLLNIRLLAEKVETREEFHQAKLKGYTYFQGFFFSKPVILSTYDIPPSILSYYELLQDLSNTEPSIEKISSLIEQDLSLSFKLLKLINSPSYRPKYKISSVRQAIVLLGLIEIQRWIYILALREQVGSHSVLSDETVRLSLTRAKMCELIGARSFKQSQQSVFFLTGMFSLMDTILSIPMEKVLKELPLLDEITEALNGEVNSLKIVLDLVISVERGDWMKTDQYCKDLHIEPELVGRFYQSACEWTETVMHENVTPSALD